MDLEHISQKCARFCDKNMRLNKTLERYDGSRITKHALCGNFSQILSQKGHDPTSGKPLNQPPRSPPRFVMQNNVLRRQAWQARIESRILRRPLRPSDKPPRPRQARPSPASTAARTACKPPPEKTSRQAKPAHPARGLPKPARRRRAQLNERNHIAGAKTAGVAHHPHQLFGIKQLAVTLVGISAHDDRVEITCIEGDAQILRQADGHIDIHIRVFEAQLFPTAARGREWRHDPSARDAPASVPVWRAPAPKPHHWQAKAPAHRVESPALPPSTSTLRGVRSKSRFPTKASSLAM